MSCRYSDERFEQLRRMRDDRDKWLATLDYASAVRLGREEQWLAARERAANYKAQCRRWKQEDAKAIRRYVHKTGDATPTKSIAPPRPHRVTPSPSSRRPPRKARVDYAKLNEGDLSELDEDTAGEEFKEGGGAPKKKAKSSRKSSVPHRSPRKTKHAAPAKPTARSRPRCVTPSPSSSKERNRERCARRKKKKAKEAELRFAQIVSRLVNDASIQRKSDLPDLYQMTKILEKHGFLPRQCNYEPFQRTILDEVIKQKRLECESESRCARVEEPKKDHLEQKRLECESESRCARVEEPKKENTGRWTKEEHEAFLAGLQLYGKEWKKVAAHVKTRTTTQTRTHAQKYFQKEQNAVQEYL